jgi:lysozyme family protein
MTDIILYPDNFRIALAETLAHEGGYVNHAADPGGMTNLGITRKTWAKWTNRPEKAVTEAEMRALTVDDALRIYFAWYWQSVRASDLPGGVDFLAFDIAVNSGPGRSIRILQKAINQLGRIKLAVDGRIGPKTITAAHAVNVFDLIDEMGNARLWFYFDLSTFKTFGKGWMRRLVSTTSFATAIALGRADAMILARHYPPGEGLRGGA